MLFLDFNVVKNENEMKEETRVEDIVSKGTENCIIEMELYFTNILIFQVFEAYSNHNHSTIANVWKKMMTTEVYKNLLIMEHGPQCQVQKV